MVNWFTMVIAWFTTHHNSWVAKLFSLVIYIVASTKLGRESSSFIGSIFNFHADTMLQCLWWSLTVCTETTCMWTLGSYNDLYHLIITLYRMHDNCSEVNTLVLETSTPLHIAHTHTHTWIYMYIIINKYIWCLYLFSEKFCFTKRQR